MSPFAAPTEQLLHDAAFGAHPGLHPLPAASTPCGRWWRAVALGGQGHYSAAEAELTVLARQSSDPALMSLTASTRASHLRQLGRHSVSRPWDGRALVLAHHAESPVAQCDALTGLAADALGSTQTGLARRLLTRCEPLLDVAGWRCQLRWEWVSAETSLYEGAGARARKHAERGALLAGRCPSARHQVKSRLVLAAALGHDGGSELAEEQLVRARRIGLVPLQWASAMLLTALPQSAEHAMARAEPLDVELARCVALLARRGGTLV